MKKIIVAISLLAACAAQADLLDGLDLGGGGIGGLLPGDDEPTNPYICYMFGEDVASDFDWATIGLYQEDADGKATVGTESRATWEGGVALFGDNYYVRTSLTNQYTDDTIFGVELINDAGSTVAYSELGKAGDLGRYIIDGGDSGMNFPLNPPVYKINSFQAVPEPTSGLLFLVGGVLLGLRRRRQV